MFKDMSSHEKHQSALQEAEENSTVPGDNSIPLIQSAETALDKGASVPDVQVEDGDRDRWSRKIEFLFACIGFCVGYGNMWRFPYMCFKNGGGLPQI